MLDGDYDGAAGADLGLGWEGEEDAGSEGEDGSDWGLWRRFVFVMAEGTGVEDAVGFVVV